MTDVVRRERGEIETFDPERHRLKVAALEYGIEEAKRIKDWPALERAVDEKIAEQHRFFGWWKANVTDKGGGNSTSPRQRTGALPAREAEELTGIAKQRVSELGGWLPRADEYRLWLLGEEYIAACLSTREGGSRHDKLKGKFEWYTPEPIIDAARNTMGGIDLDPASCTLANKIVKAEVFYSEKDDGLAKRWKGRVFINPPFAHPTVQNFAVKLLESLREDVEQAVWLSNACVDTKWWQDLASIGMTCFHLGRIKFYGPIGDLQPPTLGQSIIYFGDNRGAFVEKFARFGTILEKFK